MTNREEQYQALLSSGMFWEFYPDLSGNWEEDKEKFIQSENYLDEWREN